jgi:hypothetical protein
MPKFKKVTTHDGYEEYQLQPNDFIQLYGQEIGNRMTRVEMRRVIKAYDKWLKKNPTPTPSDGIFSSIFPEITRANTGYGTQRKVGNSDYAVRYNSKNGISIGCMDFDKKAVNKIRTWANTATATKSATKKKSAKAPLAKAA